MQALLLLMGVGEGAFSRAVVETLIGPLPRQQLVKLTLNMPADLLADLERYAAMHSQLHGEKVDVATLAPHMLAWFLRNDRGFRRQR